MGTERVCESLEKEISLGFQTYVLEKECVWEKGNALETESVLEKGISLETLKTGTSASLSTVHTILFYTWDHEKSSQSTKMDCDRVALFDTLRWVAIEKGLRSLEANDYDTLSKVIKGVSHYPQEGFYPFSQL